MSVVQALVVDDDIPILEGVTRVLTSEGFHVDTAEDGETAVELGSTRIYEVIVLDIMLPKLNGYRVCRELRQRGVRTPILLLSAKAGEWEIADGLDVGADDYLTKPFSGVELAARVRARVRSGMPRMERYVAGDLVFEPGLRRCSCRGRSVQLTAREVSLLQSLFERAGQVVSKEELLAAAWGPAHRGAPNVVEVYVARLRKKLDAVHSDRCIHTVRGAGYVLSVDLASG